MPSFREAVRHGVTAVELDVYWHHSELLVIHDDTLQRTTNGKGPLKRQSLRQLRQLDAGEGARIPWLAEVFAAVPARIAMNIELKGPGTAGPVATALADWQPPHQVLVSSFDLRELARFRQQDQCTPVAALFHTANRHMLQIATELNACSINLNKRIATAKRLAAVREAGFGALVYTVNTLRSAERLKENGATGIFTDRPDRMQRLLQDAR